MHKLILARQTEKELSALPQQMSKRIAVALNELVTFGMKSPNVKKLQMPSPGYRKRVGDYRILFEVNEEVIIVYRITKRSEAYR